MRVIHLERPEHHPWVEPLCGEWGAMDTDWTDDVSAVTCAACAGALRDVGRPPAALAGREGRVRS